MKRICGQFFIPVILLLLLVGCTSKRFPHENVDTFEMSGEMGLVIGSVTVTPFRKTAADEWVPIVDQFMSPSNVYAAFDVFPDGAQQEAVATLSNIRAAIVPITLLYWATNPMNAGRVARYQSQFNDQNGQIFALKLMPGSYFIKGQSVSYKGEKELEYDLEYGSRRFEVKRGSVIYLGNLDVVAKKVRHDGKVGHHVLKDIKVVVRDRFDRDVNIYLDNFSNIKRQDIKKRVLDN